MRKIFVYIILFLMTEQAVSQTHTETFTACGKSYTVLCSHEIDNSINVSFKNMDTDTFTKPFTVVTDDLDLFAKVFRERFIKYLDADSSSCSQDEKDKSLLSYGRKLYLNYVAANTLDSIMPVAGILRVKPTINIYSRISNEDSFYYSARKYKVVKAQIEIKDGFIENIKAYVLINGKNFYFTNNYAIGFSSITNYANFNKHIMYEMYSDPYAKRIKKGDTLKSYFYIKLSNLLDYDYDLEVDRRDYSPMDTKVTIKGGAAVTLHKQMTKKLFEARIFTDFVGLKEDKPNGLIQTEVSKRINTSTVQTPVGRTFYWLFKSIGTFQYLAPTITISKLEEHNRQLPLGDLDSVRLKPGQTDTSLFTKSLHRYVSALDLYQYQSFSAGLDCNLLFFSNRNLKFNLYINAGARLGITPVSDSLTTISGDTIAKTGFVHNYSINTLQFFPEIILTFLPEERFNFSISNRFVYIKPYNNNIQLVSFAKKDNAVIYPKNGDWLNIFEMLMSIQVNPDSKLFGRVRFNSNWNNFNVNFAQIQVGYSTYILGKK